MGRTVFASDEGDVAALLADAARPLHVIHLANDPLPGFRRVLQAAPGVTLDRLAAPLEQALAQLDAALDAIVLRRVEGSGFARALARLSVPGTALDASALTDEQRSALAAAGFVFDSPTHAVFATRKPVRPRPSVTQRQAVVIGAGLAGCAAAERLCARGWHVTLVERHAQAAGEASGNHAGIFRPLLSKDDNIPTRLARAAYLFAIDYWRHLGGLKEGAQCGVLQLARDARHAQVQREVIERWRYPREFADWIDAAAAGEVLGLPVPHGGWLFRQGGWAHPASVCASMLAACGERLERRFGVGSVTLEREGGQWLVRHERGGLVAQAGTVVLACGANRFAQTASLPLDAVRGQVSHIAAGTVPDLPVVLCREAYLTPASRGLHGAGATYDSDGETALRQSSHEENLARLRSLLGDPGAAQDAPLQGRVGFRAVAPDRLPLAGAIADETPTGRLERLRDMPRQDGLYGLLGYASRGLIWAPLMAELLAAQIEGEPLPLERTLVQAVDPARFHLKRR